jgi:hypothetical protein
MKIGENDTIKKLMQLFGDLNILSFVRKCLLNLIGYVNRMDNTRKVNQVFNNTLQGCRLRGRTRNRWWNCVQRAIINAKLKIGKGGKKNRAEWENSIKEAEVRFGRYCHRRRRRCKWSRMNTQISGMSHKI